MLDTGAQLQTFPYPTVSKLFLYSNAFRTKSGAQSLTLKSVTDKQTNRQAGWFLRPDCALRSECPQFGMPAERRAEFRVPNVPRSRINERAPFRIYEHAQCRFFERTSLQRAYVIPCRQQMGSSAVLRARRSALVLATSTRCLRRAHSIGRGCRVSCIRAIGAYFKKYLLRQFCSNRVELFTIHRRHRRRK